MSPEAVRCAVCGALTSIYAPRATWGPITLHIHPACQEAYRERLAPRLRDALVRTLKRWVLQDPKGT